MPDLSDGGPADNSADQATGRDSTPIEEIISPAMSDDTEGNPFATPGNVDADEVLRKAGQSKDDSVKTATDTKSEPKEPAADDIPVSLKERAQRVGLSAADMKELGSPSAIHHAINLMERTANNLRQQQARTAAQEPEKKAEPEVDPLEAHYAKLKEQGVDEDYINSLREINKTIRDGLTGRIAELEQTLTTISAESQRRQQQEFNQTCEKYFGGLGSEWEDVFGKGTFDQLSKADPEAVNKRLALVGTAVKLSEAFPDRFSTTEELLDAALDFEHGARKHEIKQNKTREQARNQRGQFTAEPSHREQSAVATDPYDAALAHAEEVLRKAAG